MGMTTYHARKAAGLCVRCGAPSAGRTKCRACRDAANANRRAVRAETKPRPRRCQTCRMVMVSGARRVCAGCRGRPKGSNDTRPRTPRGMCCHCQAVPVVRPAKACAACKPLTAAERLRLRTAKIAAWRTAGLCVQCGGAVVDTRRSLCLACRDRRAADARRGHELSKVQAEANREICRQLGLCWRCRKRAEPGYSVCDGHRKKARAAS